jgi:hypothetical protein
MSLYTDQKTPSRRSFMLDLANDPKGGPLESLFHELCLKYGPVSRTTNDIFRTYRAHQWELSDEQVAEALSLLEAVHRETPASKNRAHVQAFWRFKFIDPESGALLADQDNMPEIDVRLGPGSSLSFTTGTKTSLYAWFLFPFESASPDFDTVCLRLSKRVDIQVFSEALAPMELLPSAWVVAEEVRAELVWARIFVAGKNSRDYAQNPKPRRTDGASLRCRLISKINCVAASVCGVTAQA